jgi:tRNA (guanine-N7-)-methyltransferase
LSARKERLLGELLPRLRLDLNASPPSHVQDLFPVPVGQVWLEIGFGSGEHLLWQAEHHKDVGLTWQSDIGWIFHMVSTLHCF